MDNFEEREKLFVSSLTDAYSEDVDYFQHVLDVLGSYTGNCPKTLYSMGSTLFQQNPALLEEFFILFPWARHPDGSGGREAPEVDHNKMSSNVSLSSTSTEVLPEISSSRQIENEEIKDCLNNDDHDVLCENIAEVQQNETDEVVDSLEKEMSESEIKTDSRNIFCSECKTRFKTKRYLMDHIRLQRCKGKTGIECPKCKMQFKAKEYLRRHIKLGTCKKTVGSINLLMCQKKTENMIFSCPKCKRPFKAKKYLREHVRLQRCSQGKKTFECPKCETSFGKLGQLLQHNKNNVNCQEKKKKELLEKRVKAKTELLEKRVKVKYAFSCSKCNKKFQTKEKLRKHEKNNSEKNSKCKPFKEVLLEDQNKTCSDCNKEFQTKGKLKKHGSNSKCKAYKEALFMDHDKSPASKVKLKKARPTEFPCKQCNNVFATRKKLRWHTDKVHSTQSYECTQCKKHFGTKESLARHVKIFHTNPLLKNYQTELNNCTICGTNFENTLELKFHLGTVHNRVFCDHCPDNFSRGECLVKHYEAVHMKSRPYRCDQCDKTFASRGGLNDHICQAHLKLWRFPCLECKKQGISKGFKRKVYWVNHIKKVHPEVDLDACYDADFKEDFLFKMVEEEDENREKLESAWEKIRETVWEEEWENIGEMIWESE